MKWLVFILYSFFSISSYAQDMPIKEIDSLYKEDQIYAGFTYNLFGNTPEDLNQNGLSLGFHLGFIKDIGLNAQRNVAIGIGLGYSINSFNQNLLINKSTTGTFEYSTLDDSNTYSKNKFVTHLIEVPIEFRWRTSTPTSYEFWRIYTGFKIGYAVSNTSKYNGDLGSFEFNSNPDFNKLQYGFTISAGYNTWNIYLYYALNSVFADNTTLNGQNLDMNAIKLGLMFYIL